jgi:hypothetical protein
VENARIRGANIKIMSTTPILAACEDAAEGGKSANVESTPTPLSGCMPSVGNVMIIPIMGLMGFESLKT